MSPHLSHFAHLSREAGRERETERRRHSGMITAVKNFNQKEIRPHSTTMERGLWGKTLFRIQSNIVRSVAILLKSVRGICVKSLSGNVHY